MLAEDVRTNLTNLIYSNRPSSQHEWTTKLRHSIHDSFRSTTTATTMAHNIRHFAHSVWLITSSRTQDVPSYEALSMISRRCLAASRNLSFLFTVNDTDSQCGTYSVGCRVCLLAWPSPCSRTPIWSVHRNRCAKYFPSIRNRNNLLASFFSPHLPLSLEKEKIREIVDTRRERRYKNDEI